MQGMQDTQVQPLGQEDPLEEGMATHSSILAWRIPRTEEPGRLESIGSQRIRHHWRNLTCTHAQAEALGMQASGARGLQSAGSVIVARGLSCLAACGLLLGQGSNPCPLY